MLPLYPLHVLRLLSLYPVAEEGGCLQRGPAQFVFVTNARYEIVLGCTTVCVGVEPHHYCTMIVSVFCFKTPRPEKAVFPQQGSCRSMRRATRTAIATVMTWELKCLETVLYSGVHSSSSSSSGGQRWSPQPRRPRTVIVS